MTKLIIAGAGRNGKALSRYIGDNNLGEVVAFLDNNPALIGSCLDGIKILSFADGVAINHDRIIISPFEPEIYKSMYEQITNLSNNEKITIDALTYEFMNAYADQRTCFIHDFAQYARDNLKGSAAECGVFRGDSAKFINRYFNDRKLYLFDTFEGFGEEHLKYEVGSDRFSFDNEYFNRNTFSDTSVNLVMGKMPFPDKVEIRKGLFPSNVENIDDTFCFVNLDMDLYQPMKAGLEFFYDRMVKGGCILLHDYFHEGLGGVKVAVEDFEKERGISLSKTPIGDWCSLAVIKG